VLTADANGIKLSYCCRTILQSATWVVLNRWLQASEDQKMWQTAVELSSVSDDARSRIHHSRQLVCWRLIKHSVTI